jgi:hypothetical protein
LQELDRHARPLGRLGEGVTAERSKALIRGRIQEVEGDAPGPDGGAQAVERDAGVCEALHQCGAPEHARREAVVLIRHEDPELAEAAQLVDADPAAFGCLGQIVRLHAPSVAMRWLGVSRRRSRRDMQVSQGGSPSESTCTSAA